MAIEVDFHSDLPIPPGEYLEEVLEDLGMSKEELARRMARPAPKLSAIFKGDKAITPDTALQLEKVVGIPAPVWTGLEAEYRLTKARVGMREEEQRLRQETALARDFPYADLVRLGHVQRTRDPVERVRELQAFLGVTSLHNIHQVPRYEAAFRYAKSLRRRPSPEAVTAWLRIGERRAHAIACSPFDKGQLKAALPAIRAMTLESPSEFEPRLRNLLADAGVALVVCPHLPKT